MLYFENDYCEGAHESILKRLAETNMEKLPGYGGDKYARPAAVPTGMFISLWEEPRRTRWLSVPC